MIFYLRNILLQLKHGKYHFLTILPPVSSTMRTCKWHIFPRNVYNSGVPQGSNLGPLLVCMNDLPMCLAGPSVQCDLFADDGTLNTANGNVDNIRRDLQQSQIEISGCCCRNRMTLNPTKTKCMLMETKQKHQKQQLPLNLNSETTPIERVSKHRLLGVTVDEQLKSQTHNKLTIFAELFLEEEKIFQN